jgi:vacuolar-type H+-ATPase subunit E/Vma4
MSKIEDIVTVEREADEALQKARDEAEEVKRKAKAEAEGIVEQARRQRTNEEKAIAAEFDKRIAAEDAEMQANLDTLLVERQKAFDAHAAGVTDWVISQLITGEK